MHGNQNEKSGGKPSLIYRSSARFAIALAVLILATAFYYLLGG